MRESEGKSRQIRQQSDRFGGNSGLYPRVNIRQNGQLSPSTALNASEYVSVMDGCVTIQETYSATFDRK